MSLSGSFLMVPDISIIIVNWNTCELLRQCLSSIGYSRELVWEILVIDNASTDGSPQLVARDFPEVQLIVNEINVGFARANNQGLAIARGRYILLLNSDTIVSAVALTELVKFMEARSEAGVCSPRLLGSNGIPQPYAFGRDPSLTYLLVRGFSLLVLKRYLHNWAIQHIQAVDWVSAACMMIRRQVIEQVGGLDENIFMYFEDNDWCLRIRHAGWKIYYNPDVSVTHLSGQSLQKNLAARTAYYQSLDYFYTKHYGPLAHLLLRIALGAYRLFVRY